MAGQITNNLGNLAAAQYLAGYRPGQQAPQPQNADPNDALAQALALNYQGPQNHGPVYSVAGGLANAAGDIGEAYAQRKRTEAILGYEQAAAGAEEKAEETAANTQAAMDYGTGTSMNVAGGAPTDPNATATLNTPSTGQQMPGVPGEGGPITTGQVSMPANMTAAQMLTPQQRGMAAQHQLAQASPLLAQQMAGRLQQTASAASPPLRQEAISEGGSVQSYDQQGNPVGKPVLGQPKALVVGPADHVVTPGQPAGPQGAAGAQNPNVAAANNFGGAPGIDIAYPPEQMFDRKLGQNRPVGRSEILQDEARAKQGLPSQFDKPHDTNIKFYDDLGNERGEGDPNDSQFKGQIASGQLRLSPPPKLSDSGTKDLTDSGTSLQLSGNLLTTYDPAYTGSPLPDSAGSRLYWGAKNSLEQKSTDPNTIAKVNWLNNYAKSSESLYNNIRARGNPTLVDQFNKSQINEGTGAGVAQSNLWSQVDQQRQVALQTAQGKLAQGHTQAQVESTLGMPVAALQSTPAFLMYTLQKNGMSPQDAQAKVQALQQSSAPAIPRAPQKWGRDAQGKPVPVQ